MNVDAPQCLSDTLSLPERVVMASCVELKVQLLDAIGRGQPLTVDAEQVREIDFSGLQLLVSAQKTAASKGVELTFSPESAGSLVAEAFERCGLHI